ncbi:MFS transporter [Eggerthellaceae bacterium 24-137]
MTRKQPRAAKNGPLAQATPQAREETASSSDGAASSSPAAPSAAPACSGATRERHFMIAVLFAGNVLASLMQSIMNVALDYVCDEFHVGLSEANLLVLCYAVVAGTVITMAASLLRRFGLRRIIGFGLVMALAGSLLGAFAWNYPSLLAARLVQAVTTGLFFPVINEALLVLSPKGRAGVLLALNSGIIGVGLALAPVVSGLVITYWGLRVLFLIPAVLAAVLLVAAVHILHDIMPRERRPIDVVSVALSFTGLAAFMVGLNELTRFGAPMVALMLGGVGVCGLFVWRQGRIAHPLLDMSPFRNPLFALGESLVVLSYIASMYLNLLIPLYLEGVAGYTPFIAGCLLAPAILCYAGFCFMSGRILGKRGVWPLVPAGFAVTLVAFGAMVVAARFDAALAMVACVAAAYGSVGIAYPAIKSVDLEVLAPAQSSSGSSIHSTLVQISGSVSSALFVGLMSGRVSAARAAGVAKAAAYGDGIGFTLWIAIALLAVATVVAVVYARKVRRHVQSDPAMAPRG